MESTQGSSGPATDRYNEPFIDPTKNVLDLVAAAIQRQDDLRRLEADHLRQVIALRAEIAATKDMHSKELRAAEAARIDAIRTIDVGNVSRAAEVATTQAATLAAQVALSAETLRNQVAAAASAATVALAAALEPVQKDIADLRRAQYEAQGQKTQVVETRERGGSVGLWVSLAVAVMVGFATVVIGATTLLILLLR